MVVWYHRRYTMESKTSNKQGEEPEESRTLSRQALYAPLQAYDRGNLAEPKKVPKSCTEAALVDWIHEMSADYHQSCTPGDPRNTGNRFVSVAEAQEKIMYRTLSLFGKDYGSKLGGTSLLDKAEKPVQRKKRKRQSKCSLVVEDTTEVETTLEFLETLSKFWTEYMLKLLKAKGCGPFTNPDDEMLSKASRSIMECASMIEWVGAKTRIVECQTSPQWKGRQGVLVSSRKNTWVMYEISKNSKRVTQLTIPKRGAVLVASLPLLNAQVSASLAEIDASTLQIHLQDDRIS